MLEIPETLPIDPHVIQHALNVMQNMRYLVAHQKYERDQLSEVESQLRKVLAQIPGTFADERCSLAGCQFCDTKQANSYLEED